MSLRGGPRPAALVAAVLACATSAAAAPGQEAVAGAEAGEDEAKEFVARQLEAGRDEYASLAREIWGLAELGYREEESSALLRERLAEAGFRVERGVAGLPTAFVASWGSGEEPVVALLAEFDALPGFSQDTVPRRARIPGRSAGHACGHNLLGTAAAAAGVAVKRWLEESGVSGTVRVYGTPAEEGGAGKVYMARSGLFDDVDAALHWHPRDRNRASALTSLAVKSAKFRFRGRAAHAASAPDRGRSALDGVEAMNDMVNMLREHVPEETRIHYSITRGGDAPNVVPEAAEAYYYVRHPDAGTAEEIFERVRSAAEGAALGTGTDVEVEVMHGIFNLLPNRTLSRVAHRNLSRVGGVTWTSRERAFAAELRETLGGPEPPEGLQEEVQPFAVESFGASTDVGDVSWLVPTAGIETATLVPGTSLHSWQAMATTGTGIGTKGMMNAARAMATTAVDLYREPGVIEEAWEELRRRRGPEFTYSPLLGDREPPLDYRR